MIFASIRYNLANLVRFSGRESRGLFWPYAIAVFLLGIAVGILLLVPIMVDTMTRAVAYAQAHPGGFPQPVPGQPPALPPELMPDMTRMMVPMMIVNLLGILLLAAAAVRRLHDRDMSGWWAALPIPFHIISALIAPAVARQMTQAMTTFPPRQSPLMLVSTLNGAFALLALVILVVLLVGESTRGPNRFGDPVPSN